MFFRTLTGHRCHHGWPIHCYITQHSLFSACRVRSRSGLYKQHLQIWYGIGKTNEPTEGITFIINLLSIYLSIYRGKITFSCCVTGKKYVFIQLTYCSSLPVFPSAPTKKTTFLRERGYGRGDVSGTLHNFVCFCRREYSKLSTWRKTFVSH